MKRWPNAIMISSFVVLICCGLLLGTSQVKAGYFSDLFNGVKQISELPEEVNELKANYQITLDKLSEAQETLETYRQQNEELLERNKEMAASVAALTEAQQSREASMRKTRTLIIVGASLLAGYFIVLRGLRLILRR